MTGIELRPYQRDCVSAVNEALGRGVRSQLVVLPTAGGEGQALRRCAPLAWKGVAP